MAGAFGIDEPRSSRPTPSRRLLRPGDAEAVDRAADAAGVRPTQESFSAGGDARTSRGAGASRPSRLSQSVRDRCEHRGTPFLSLPALWALSRMPARQGAGIRAFRNAGAVRRLLGLPDELVGEVGEAVTDG